MDSARRAFCLRTPLAFAVALVALPGTTRVRQESQAGTRIVSIEARRFSFTPNKITLARGVPVILEITALDFPHGFNIPDMDLRTTLIPGKAVRLPLTPTTAGDFPFLCDNFCGSGHEQMDGKITVTA